MNNGFNIEKNFSQDHDNNSLEAVEDPLKGGFELQLKVRILVILPSGMLDNFVKSCIFFSKL